MLRIKPASETLHYLLTQLDKFGISRIADLTYLDDSTNLNVYAAMRPNSRSLTTSMGKGQTIDEAKCSALMESIEAFYAEQVLSDITNLSIEQLSERKDIFVNPNQITDLISIKEDFPINWCLGKLLNSKKTILIPHCFLSLDSNQVMIKLVGQNSDGLASGNSFEEALVYSFWEVNERISLKNDKRPLGVESSIISPYVGDAVSVDFFLYQSNFNIPVVECHIRNKNPLNNRKIFAGYASHSNINIAVKKALFEAIQTKIGIISGVRDDIVDDFYLYSGKNTIDARSSNIEMSSSDQTYTELSIAEEFMVISKLLRHYQKDLAYYCYIDNNITVLKSFLVDL